MTRFFAIISTVLTTAYWCWFLTATYHNDTVADWVSVWWVVAIVTLVGTMCLWMAGTSRPLRNLNISKEQQ